MKRVYLFRRYERLWHWVQAALILALLTTGFVIHGYGPAVDFERVLGWHETAGIVFIVLSAFTMFWHVTTGEGKQFFPKTRGLADQIRFYTSGIFRREPHPEVPTPDAKFNPLQRLAYLGLLILIFPVQLATGFILWATPRWEAVARLGPDAGFLALLHTAGAWASLVFVIVHLYMITTGRSPLSNFRAMLTGWMDDDHS